MSIANCLEQLIAKRPLASEEMVEAVKEMLASGDAAQIGAFLVLLRAKGETVDELVGLVKALREQAKPALAGRPIVDIVGTGGDQAGTANLSTGSALLAALCGVPVVKHGNRAVSSQCGSADVLEALGFDIHEPLNPESNFNFCFAPDYHPALAKVRAVRHALKIPTAFNMLGPLLNPAGIDHLQIGVFRPELVPVMAEVLFRLGTKKSLIFHGHGLDELSCIGPIDALLVTEKGIEPMRIDPQVLGLKKCTLQDLKGGDAKMNAELLLRVFRGEDSPLTDTLILNAAAAQFLVGATLEEGVLKARQKLKRKSLKESLSKHPVIAEIKRSSPSKGKIGAIEDPAERALLYAKGGAGAISVLTDHAFDGTLKDLQAVSAVSPVPVLRKGFFTEKKHIREAKFNGADAILLIVSRLGERTQEMLEEAKRFGLEALVEVHTEAELEMAKGAEIIGVNQRDLDDFSMHPEVYEQLIGKIPAGAIAVAESGMKTKSDIAHVRKLGYHAVLMGEALTRAEDPEALICS